MSFGQPWVLLLLVLPLVGLIRHFRGSDRQPVVWPVDFSTARGSRWMALLVTTCEGLPWVVAAMVIVLLAGPERLGQPISKRIATNIELCVDVSGSMTAPLGDGTRYDTSMVAINQFIDSRRGDAFGMTFFGDNVIHWVPLTNDVSAVKCSPPFMRPERVPPWMGGTMVGKAVDACRKVLLERDEGDRIVIVVTDGMSADLMNGEEVELAQRLKRDGVVVYAIHVAEGDAPGPMVNLSQLTGGEVFVAGDPEGLNAIFQRIDIMQKTRFERTAPERQDFFAPVCAAALAMLGTTLMTAFGLRYTPW